MNTLQEVGNQLHCSCGAKAEPKDRKRFANRHPRICSKPEKPEIKLSEPPKITDPYKHYLERIEAEGKKLTDWEQKFVKDMQIYVSRMGTNLLSENQRKHIEKIYIDRVP